VAAQVNVTRRSNGTSGLDAVDRAPGVAIVVATDFAPTTTDPVGVGLLTSNGILVQISCGSTSIGVCFAGGKPAAIIVVVSAAMILSRGGVIIVREIRRCRAVHRPRGRQDPDRGQQEAQENIQNRHTVDD
jgi:hypothetical protein